ncbi:hypothetical protein BCR33DRAFT_767623 [Rhizoclosmatium globosum]|uniref:Uncharacterized protein n=1 Tax=Rhizoclosmatium globosum TaxID=329046 RepID=A0A1Y2C304_9FUNG|nr:hypothetical protein BCR33DRAFT_767623 [Rhizoclosmatium globosum]|eukprot:ORY41326.1 hypothetical protein BCR33DRAFT_767623 [Rhizoclosmatium globosum]
MNTLELTPSKRRLVEDIHQMPDTSKATGLLVLGILANRARSQPSFTSLDCPAKVFTDLNLPVRPVQDMVKECMDWTEKQQRNYTVATPDAPSETKFAREKTSKLLSAIKTQFKKKLQKWDTRVFNVDQAIQDLYGDDPRHKDKTLDAAFPDDALDRKTVVYLLVYCSRLQAAFNLKENYWAYCSALFANFLNPNTNREAVLANVRFQLMGEEVEQVVCQPSPAVPESSLRGPESSQSPTVLPNSPEAIQEQDNE